MKTSMPKTSKIILAAAVVTIVITGFAVVKRLEATPVSKEQATGNNPYPISSPARSAQENFLKWQMDNRQLGRASVTPSLADRQKLASRLVVTGMPRLADHLLVGYLPLVSKILDSLDSESCGKFVQGKLSSGQIVASINKVISEFNADEAKTWFSVEESAIQASLDGKPIVQVKSEEIPTDLIKLADSLPSGQSAEFQLRLRKLPVASYAEACKVVRTLYSQGSRLDEPYRARIARLLLTVRAS